MRFDSLFSFFFLREKGGVFSEINRRNLRENRLRRRKSEISKSSIRGDGRNGFERRNAFGAVIRKRFHSSGKKRKMFTDAFTVY